jgi:aspartate-semialdehyde dehydrogenase
MEPDVPLVVPEVNQEAMSDRPRHIISNANCTVMAMIMAIAPLHREYGLRELVLASYQAASGAGQIGVDTLHDQLSKVAGDRLLGSRPGNVRQAVGDDLGPFSAPLALNVVPWSGEIAALGWSSEELKLRNESRKILGIPALKVSATCVRVPVVTGHSIAVHAVFGSEVTADGARQVLRNAPGVILVDDPEAGEFPMPIDAVGTDPSWVGRIRRAMDDPRALDLFITGDNMRKGAALNTVQIAELLAATMS